MVHQNLTKMNHSSKAMHLTFSTMHLTITKMHSIIILGVKTKITTTPHPFQANHPTIHYTARMTMLGKAWCAFC